MKREPLKVGDRVAVYDRNLRFTGVVVGFHDGDPDHVNVRADGRSMPTSPYCQRKQLRRLIRRKRRRWEGEWHCNYLPDGSVRVLFSPDADAQDGLPKNGERMTLVEARPGKAGRR